MSDTKTPPPPVEELLLPQHMRPLAIKARLQALLEGLGIPHSDTWYVKPIKEFHKLGQLYLYKLQGLEPPNDDEHTARSTEPGEPEFDYTKSPDGT